MRGAPSNLRARKMPTKGQSRAFWGAVGACEGLVSIREMEKLHLHHEGEKAEGIDGPARQQREAQTVWLESTGCGRVTVCSAAINIGSIPPLLSSAEARQEARPEQAWKRQARRVEEAAGP